jgi:hypothetical protein
VFQEQLCDVVKFVVGVVALENKFRHVGVSWPGDKFGEWGNGELGPLCLTKMSSVPSGEIFGDFVWEGKGAKRRVIFIPNFGISKRDLGIIKLVGGRPGSRNINGGQFRFLILFAYIFEHTIGGIFGFCFANIVDDFCFIRIAKFMLEDGLIDGFLDAECVTLFCASLNFFAYGCELEYSGLEGGREFGIKASIFIILLYLGVKVMVVPKGCTLFLEDLSTDAEAIDFPSKPFCSSFGASCLADGTACPE